MMENSKQPITPVWMTQNGKDSFIALKPGQKTGYEKHFMGLTKLEYFSGIVIQGMLSTLNQAEKEYLFDKGSDRFCGNCIDIARELLTQLENK